MTSAQRYGKTSNQSSPKDLMGMPAQFISRINSRKLDCCIE